MRAALLALLASVPAGMFVTSSPAIIGFLPQPASGTIGGGAATFSTITKQPPLTCGKLDASTIKFEKDHHASGTLEFLGCKLSGFAAASLGDSKETVLATALFLVCLKAGKALWGLTIELDEDLHIEVPALGTLLALKGRFIGELLTEGKAKEFKVRYSGKEGKPDVAKCTDEEGLGKEHTLLLELNHNGKPETASAQIEEGLVKFTEELELMTK